MEILIKKSGKDYRCELHEDGKLFTSSFMANNRKEYKDNAAKIINRLVTSWVKSKDMEDDDGYQRSEHEAGTC